MKDKRKTKKKRDIKNKINGKRALMKNGWIRVSIYGNAFERGFAHGHLLANELNTIYDAFDFILKTNIGISHGKYTKFCKDKIVPRIQENFPEFFEEMQGISAGAIAAGYTHISFDFIVEWNAILSTYTIFPERCSAFISIYEGKIVMAHNTHTDFLTGQIKISVPLLSAVVHYAH
jgi:hypothetical protein